MPFVPDSFTPPRTFKSESFRLEVLSPVFADEDHRAVRDSAAAIRGVFGPSNGWPPEAISFEANLADLARHEREFEERVAFAYAIIQAGRPQYLGCVYVKPLKSGLEPDHRKERFQAQVFFWLASGQRAVSTEQVVVVLQEWLAKDWPFAAVAFPGRVQGWNEWDAMSRASAPRAA